MSDESSAQPAAPAQPIAETKEAVTSAQDAPAASETASAANEDAVKPAEGAADKPAAAEPATTEEEAPAKPAEETGSAKDAEKPAEASDVEMKDAPQPEAAPAAPAAEAKPEAGKADDADDAAPAAAAAAAAEAPSTPADAKGKARRKSAAGAEQKGKKLSKKASKARITHLDAKPGDHFFMRLKGYPPWPVIICDEEMLPLTLTKSRPVSAARPDGTYREDYADGGKRAPDRSFPVMYLSTNEFGWVSNTDLADLDPDTVLQAVNPKTRKDLAAAHELAAEKHDLDHYKNMLQQFQEALEEEQKAQEAKAAATPAKKSRKSKGAEASADEDVDMADAADEEQPAKKSKKRKADEEAATPQRSESVKKPKIKLTNNSTPKAANGVPTPKSAKGQSEAKPSKSKPSKKGAEDKKAEKEAPKEPELSPEERHQRKEKEVLFLRHKLQKGLLTRDQKPKEEEMKTMSDFVSKLESFPDLEVSIIRVTKINKVLKAILKIDNIPKEEEFQFKPRSQALLDKWNKLLAVDGAAAGGSANGVNGASADASDKKEAKKPNGVKEAEKPEAGPEPAKAEEKKEEPAAPEKTEQVEKPLEAVEAAA